jgi:ferric-dicitrate binding protein FerR (iron transport regulator)
MKQSLLLWVGLSCVTLPVYAQETPAPFEARLTQVSGDVSVIAAGGNAEGTTVPGEMPLVEGDQVKVGPHGSAEIALTGPTVIQLLEGSSLRIKQLSEKNVIFRLDNGTFLAKVKFEKKDGNQLSVETPTAVAAVRGTEFVVQQESFGSRIGVLDEGHVAVSAPGSSDQIMLHFNQETRVRRGLSPEKAQALQHLYHYKTQMSLMRERVHFLHKHWNNLTPEQRQMVRDAWVKTHPRQIPDATPVHKTLRKSHPHSHSSQAASHTATVNHDSN